MFTRRDIFRGSFALLPALHLLAQEQSSPQFSTDVKVVDILATVRDKQGRIVHDLAAEDFTIEEDGRPQAIRYFSKQSNLPLTLGLLVDTSQSERNEIDPERRASYQFFDQVLRPDKDKAFVIHFDRQVELLQDLTSSRQELSSALDNLSTERPELNRGNSGQYPRGGGGRGYRGGGTMLYDAVFLASDELLKKQQGRKAIVLLSDGEDRGSKESLSSCIEAAQRADTLVYSLHFHEERMSPGFGPGFGGGRRGMGRNRFPEADRTDGKKVLERISAESGGRYFEISGKQTISSIYSLIEDELRNQYSLGYTPDRPGSGYHTIRIALKQKNMTAQTRQGYYSR